jgi:hypothetical protein
MFFLVWRGYGLLGLIPPVLGLVAFGFLAENPIKVATLGAGLTITMTGIAVAVAGWFLNRNGNRHSLYALPMWVWGGGEVVLGLILAGYVMFQVFQFGWKGDFRSVRPRSEPSPPPALVEPKMRPGESHDSARSQWRCSCSAADGIRHRNHRRVR